MTEPTAALTEQQARDTAALARELLPTPAAIYRATARDRAVDRLIRIHRRDYKRLLAEEHAKGEQP